MRVSSIFTQGGGRGGRGGDCFEGCDFGCEGQFGFRGDFYNGYRQRRHFDDFDDERGDRGGLLGGLL